LNGTINQIDSAPLIIITAEKGGGKTTCIKRILSFLNDKSMPHTGFFSEGTWLEGERHSFTLNLVPGSEKVPLCDRTTESWTASGKFRYNPEALLKGAAAVERAIPGEIIIMDEIGLQELSHRVWAEALNHALIKNQNPMIVSVQYRCLDGIMAKWNLHYAHIFDGTKYGWDDLLIQIKQLISC
jgi:nucleoside-triphosphatase THEP1